MPALPLHVPNAFTVDVEDYFQVSAFEHRVSRKHWADYESRVEANTDKLLTLLDQHSVRGTFFILGWVADRYPALVRRIQAGGHELASHGYWHHLVYRQTPEEFASDVAQSKDAIASASGVAVTAYRAPSFSIVQRSLWALEILAEHGFAIDSSIFPIAGHDRYGMPGAQKEIHALSTPAGTIVEFPPSAWHVGRVNIPVGGGYFRILPLAMTLKAMAMIRRAGRPAMFYIHPWEVDPTQPRLGKLGRRTRFRHYSGLQRTEARLRKLLAHQPFATLSETLTAVGWPSAAPTEAATAASLPRAAKLAT